MKIKESKMNNSELLKAADKAIEKITTMSDQEFLKLLEETADGPISAAFYPMNINQELQM